MTIKKSKVASISLIVGLVFGSFGMASQAVAAPKSTSVSVSAGSAVSVSTKSVIKMKAKAKTKKQTKAQRLAAKRAKITRAAKSGVGVRYRFGGNSRKGWDCSGFVTYSYKKAGHKVKGRYTTRSIKNNSSFKKTKHPRSGDVVYQGSKHVGIYIGKKKGKHYMISARNPRAGTTAHPVYNWNGNKPVSFYTLKS